MQPRSLSILAASLLVVGCAQQAPTPSTAAQVQPQAPVTVGQELGAAVRNNLQVTFGPGSDRLSADANRQLDVAARLFRDVRPVSMFSAGYSDAEGDEYTNLILAARRARAVKAGLVARGIPANQVLLRSFGESDPLERSDPNAAANRRVVVTWDIL